MSIHQLGAAELNTLYQHTGFLVINDLPVGTQLTIDHQTWITGPRFKGIKLIPPGFHLITITLQPTPTTSTPTEEATSVTTAKAAEPMRIGYEVRRGLLRFFEGRERVIRGYTAATEGFSTGAEETIGSVEYMQTLDGQLAAYPFEAYARWRRLTAHITPGLVARVLGADVRGDSLLDSLMANHPPLGPQPSLPPSASARTQWGKPRPHPTAAPMPDTPSTHWPAFDLRRSWPPDATGPERTRWSRDKSWLLRHLMHREFHDDPREVLGLLQLAFVVFMEVQSIGAFEFFQSLIDLISGSGEVLVESSPVGRIDYKLMRVEVISVFVDQLSWLNTGFFAESMEDFQIENWFFGRLDRFRRDLGTILHASTSAPDGQLAQRVGLIDWRAVQLDCRRFDWNVRPVCPPAQEEEDVSGDDDDSDSDGPVVVGV